MRVFALLMVIIGLSSCAETTATQSSTATTLEIESLDVAETVPTTGRYPAALSYSLSGPAKIDVEEACFTWSGEGPYCFPVEVDTTTNTAVAMLRTGNPNTYELAGFLRYRVDGEVRDSNTASATIIAE